SIKKALDIEFDVRTFKLYNFVQSLMYHSKATRVDDDNKKMKIIDLGKQDASEKFVKQYIRHQYNNKYNHELVLKAKVEKQMIVDESDKVHIETPATQECIKLFKEGITRGNSTMIICDASKIGFVNLKDALLDLNVEVPYRAEKLCIL